MSDKNINPGLFRKHSKLFFYSLITLSACTFIIFILFHFTKLDTISKFAENVLNKKRKPNWNSIFDYYSKLSLFISVISFSLGIIIKYFHYFNDFYLRKIESKFSYTDNMIFPDKLENKYYYLATFIIPALFIVLFVYLISARGSFYFGNYSDPDYVYLFNSLRVSELKSPVHIDHPGTTLQVIGGIFIKLSNIGSNTDAIRLDVIKNSRITFSN